MSAVKAGVRAVADEARKSPDRRQYGRFTPATWAEGASILMTILACRPSLIDPNQIGRGTTSIGPCASALRERLASSQGRHSKSGHCLESAPRISSVNADAATTNGGFGKRALASRDRIVRVQRARRPEGRTSKHRSCDILPHLSRACVRLAQTCVLMSSSGQTVFVTESSVKVQPSSGYADDLLVLGNDPSA